MAAQSNVGQSMAFHHKWRFYSIFTGRGAQRCELWMILIKCSCSECVCVFAWLDLNGLLSDTVRCSVWKFPAVRNTPAFSLISSNTNTHTHTNGNPQQRLKMAANGCICILSESRKHTMLFVALCCDLSYAVTILGKCGHVYRPLSVLLPKFYKYLIDMTAVSWK